MTARDELLRRLVERRLADVKAHIKVAPEHSAIMSEEVEAEAAWYLDALQPVIDAAINSALEAAATSVDDCALTLMTDKASEGSALTAAILDRAAAMVRTHLVVTP